MNKEKEIKDKEQKNEETNKNKLKTECNFSDEIISEMTCIR